MGRCCVKYHMGGGSRRRPKQGGGGRESDEIGRGLCLVPLMEKTQGRAPTLVGSTVLAEREESRVKEKKMGDLEPRQKGKKFLPSSPSAEGKKKFKKV